MIGMPLLQARLSERLPNVLTDGLSARKCAQERASALKRLASQDALPFPFGVSPWRAQGGAHLADVEFLIALSPASLLRTGFAREAGSFRSTPLSQRAAPHRAAAQNTAVWPGTADQRLQTRGSRRALTAERHSPAETVTYRFSSGTTGRTSAHRRRRLASQDALPFPFGVSPWRVQGGAHLADVEFLIALSPASLLRTGFAREAGSFRSTPLSQRAAPHRAAAQNTTAWPGTADQRLQTRGSRRALTAERHSPAETVTYRFSSGTTGRTSAHRRRWVGQRLTNAA
ncbi:hypothetical protein NDU88_004249 [Pleurodeles waltl]|uniref:Uncharacterized protein n=1 Tax=Pleurodeles waltl TaxID=8319 RepID=A0AAV7M8S2_PLEWA|nr:hypothetical protein NDU88_004249 [Pleurodeles waltl]